MDNIDIAIDSILKHVGKSLEEYKRSNTHAVDSMRVVMRGAVNNELLKRLDSVYFIVHDIAMAAYDEGVDSGIAWCPDAKEGSRGVTPLTPEEGLAYSRSHFSEYGEDCASSEYAKAMMKLRDNLRGLPAPPQACA